MTKKLVVSICVWFVIGCRSREERAQEVKGPSPAIALEGLSIAKSKAEPFQDLTKECLVKHWQEKLPRVRAMVPEKGWQIADSQGPGHLCLVEKYTGGRTTELSTPIKIRALCVAVPREAGRRPIVFGGDEQGNLIALDFETGKQDSIFIGQEIADQRKNAMTRLAVSPTRSHLLVSIAGRLSLWDFGKKSRLKSAEFGFVEAMDFSPDGGRIALRAGDLIVIDAVSLTEVWRKKPSLRQGSFCSLHFSNDGKVLVAAESDNTLQQIHFLDPNSEAPLVKTSASRLFEIEFFSGPRGSRSSQVRVSPDGLFYVHSFWSAQAHIREMSTKKLIGLITMDIAPIHPDLPKYIRPRTSVVPDYGDGDHGIYSIDFSSASQWITSEWDGHFSLWDIAPAKKALLAKHPANETERRSLFWSNLASMDALTGLVTTEYFLKHAKEFLENLSEHGPLPTLPAEKAIDGLIQALGDPVYANREKSQKERFSRF